EVEASVDGGWVEAKHSLPVVTANGGPVLSSPLLVTITYADDTNRAFEEALGAFMPTSKWLTNASEYGVGPGTSANVELTDDAPATIDDGAIQTLIASLITAGTAPDPLADAGADAGAFRQAVYVYYVPPTTNVTYGSSTLCQISSGGYHFESSNAVNGHTFAYAVVSPCPNGLPVAAPENLVWAASHEFVEACTDPYPVSAAGFVMSDTAQPWADIGGEVGDLCTFVFPQASEGPYTALQRIYSNASAKAGGDPCLPSQGTAFGADVEPQAFVPLAAGKSTTFQVTGWSTAPTAPWSLTADPYAVQGNAQPPTVLGTSTLQNGETTTLTVTMPAGTPSGTVVDLYVTSAVGNLDYSTAVAGVYVP
ncbi:MAG TPA: hypothetical protein VIY73_11350, partial [Polyangiaceae bacterium]